MRNLVSSITFSLIHCCLHLLLHNNGHTRFHLRPCPTIFMQVIQRIGTDRILVGIELDYQNTTFRSYGRICAGYLFYCKKQPSRHLDEHEDDYPEIF